jgi:hypothetical protein
MALHHGNIQCIFRRLNVHMFRDFPVHGTTFPSMNSRSNNDHVQTLGIDPYKQRIVVIAILLLPQSKAYDAAVPQLLALDHMLARRRQVAPKEGLEPQRVSHNNPLRGRLLKDPLRPGFHALPACLRTGLVAGIGGGVETPVLCSIQRPQRRWIGKGG